MPAKQPSESRLNCPNEGGIIVGAIVIVAGFNLVVAFRSGRAEGEQRDTRAEGAEGHAMFSRLEPCCARQFQLEGTPD
jgi:hypothetical protein